MIMKIVPLMLKLQFTVREEVGEHTHLQNSVSLYNFTVIFSVMAMLELKVIFVKCLYCPFFKDYLKFNIFQKNSCNSKLL